MNETVLLERLAEGLASERPQPRRPSADARGLALADLASLTHARIEGALQRALEPAMADPCPRGLAGALRYAVFPGGARLRPRLCLAVAWACGDDDPEAAAGAAAAIELLHCASLVHDDLPCFDDAALRRGKATVHRAYGEQIALLAGDALIVLAFETLARTAAARPQRLATLVRLVAQAVGAPSGIAAGQAWECEPSVRLDAYHRSKTGALFAAATACGAAAAGHEAEPWRLLGECLGEAYQVADDVRDAHAAGEEFGKTCGRDAALGRPSAVTELGLDGALARLKGLIAGALACVPACPGAADLKALILREQKAFLPKDLARDFA